MKGICRQLGYTLVATLALAGVGPARSDTVTDWNAIMQTNVIAAGNPVFQTRWAAITQLAVFEAVNAITGDYESYTTAVTAPSWASPDAAAIAAAHRTLVTLLPGRAGVLDPLRDQYLAAIPEGPAKDAGIQAGEDAAAAMLQLRANDGSATAQVPYTGGTNPGDYQPLPGQTAQLPLWGQVTPFGLQDGSQFRLPAPPDIKTEKYAEDLNEVKRLGKSDAPLSVRPQHRTDCARFYRDSSPVFVFNTAARQVCAAQGKTLSEKARIFALLGMAMADGQIAVYDTKYHYKYWRPQAAIRGADTDENPLTDADPTWLPLISTPPHPSYASGHASSCGAGRVMLERLLGVQGHNITLSNVGLVFNYTTFAQITADVDDARIYGGIHFRFDQEGGNILGRMISTYIVTHYLKPANP